MVTNQSVFNCDKYMYNVLYMALPDAPTVTIQQCSTPVTEGDDATLYCNATGSPVPRTAWIRASTGDILSRENAYIITAIKRTESGSYECLAWNGIGNNSTKSCTIDVQCKYILFILIAVGRTTVGNMYINTLRQISK